MGIENSDGTIAMCFNPRHALRFELRGQDVKIEVCFECLHGEIAGFPGFDSFYNTSEPSSVWNEVLESHHVQYERD
jgi:hypothetical protein